MTRARQLIFVTHAEVHIDPSVAVPDWGLSDVGQQRHQRFAAREFIRGVSVIYTSCERKAMEGAVPIAQATGLTALAIRALGENDRSATGYLPSDEFEATADAFFASPDDSIRGWETARAAQARIVACVQTLLGLDTSTGDILIVAHGAVGALLRCHLLSCDITRNEDQPAGGGCYFTTDLSLSQPPTQWSRI